MPGSHGVSLVYHPPPPNPITPVRNSPHPSFKTSKPPPTSWPLPQDRALLSPTGCAYVQAHTDIRRLEFLPYHFLLASVGDLGVLRFQVRHLHIHPHHLLPHSLCLQHSYSLHGP